MSMQIEFKDDYNETTYYFGTVKEPESTSHGEYDFTVVIAYFSTQGSWTITEIIWDKEPTHKDKAESRISDMVMEWHGKRCDIDMVITAQDPGDEND